MMKKKNWKRSTGSERRERRKRNDGSERDSRSKGWKRSTGSERRERSQWNKRKTGKLKWKCFTLKCLVILSLIQQNPLTIGSESDRTVCGPIFPLENRYFCTVHGGVSTFLFIYFSKCIFHDIICHRTHGIALRPIAKLMVWDFMFQPYPTRVIKTV